MLIIVDWNFIHFGVTDHIVIANFGEGVSLSVKHSPEVWLASRLFQNYPNALAFVVWVFEGFKALPRVPQRFQGFSARGRIAAQEFSSRSLQKLVQRGISCLEHCLR